MVHRLVGDARWLARCALSLSLAAVGCLDGSPVVQPGDSGGQDAHDSAEASAMDAPETSVRMDVPPADVMRRCMGNSDCMGNPAGAVCDTASGRCVGCVATPDSCAGDQHCDSTTNTCVRGCHDDTGCAGAMPSGDGGVDAGSGPGAASRCNTMTHNCVQCVTNDHCPAGQTCAGNVCVIGCDTSARCPMGQTCCAGGCVDTQTNAAHCMMCGRTCSVPNGSGSCQAGACVVGTCTDPFRDCDGMIDNGCETNTQDTLAHCGGCGRLCPTRAHATATCSVGTCGFTCAAGFADCNGMPDDGCEVDLGQDPAHCGTCTTMCATANGAPACTMGACATGMCTPGFGDCDGNPTNGCETNTQNTSSACGGCGMACTPLPNANAACVMGRCGLGACLMGFADCDGDPMNGCEVDLATSTGNCGRCGNACNVAGGTAACVMGACAVASCGVGLADCDGMPATGCETDTRTSTTHCGRCGTACPTPAQGTAGCTAGTCGIGTCNPGFADCDGRPDTGCEVELGTNATHCGRCGNSCTLANATAVCRGGACAVGTCNTGFADCDGNPANGCEVNTTTALDHCGACGHVCVAANGTAACRAGACAVATCDPGFADCDGNPANGCEVVTLTDTNHCNGCGMRCPTPPSGTAVCVAGACGIGTCPSGFSDCNGLLSDGCEIASSRDTSNCGRCGNVCPTPPNGASVCTGGICGLGACNTGFADCDSVPTNGCEVNVTTSLDNCGGCGRTCAPANASGVCSAGACRVASCNAGFADCDGNPANGCEVNIAGDVSNCGGCARPCTAPTGGSVVCSASTCVPSCPAGQSNCGGVCRPTGGACTSAGTGGCANTGTIVCSGTSTTCSATPRTSGSCTSPTGGVCDGAGTCGCPSGQTNCGGVCRTLSSDPSNCNACGTVCTAPTGGSGVCTGGVCSQVCPTGQSNCSGVCQATGGACTSAGTGGCANTGTTVCSGTSTTCSATPRTSGTCTTPTGGACTTGGTCACPTGQTNCSGTCRDTQNDVTNCGTCGNNCGAGRACSAGTCIGSGSLRFTLTWSTPGDMDLHVLPPCGTEIYYASRTNCGGTLDVDNTTTTGPENVFWSGSYTPGTYYVCAEAYTSAVASATYTLVVVVGTTEVRRVTGVRGVTDGNRACGAGFNQLAITL